MPELLTAAPPSFEITLILAHGAGAAMDSAYMNTMSGLLVERGVRVVRFEFPYMAARRGGRRPGPDRQSVLLDTWRAVARDFDPAVTVIGGKSIGGRMASMVADELGVAALVCLGYPFHPPGRPDRLRTAHLEHLATRALIIQGTRDPFGTREDVAPYLLSNAIAVHWIEGADHDLKSPKAFGRTHSANLAEAAATIAIFLHA